MVKVILDGYLFSYLSGPVKQFQSWPFFFILFSKSTFFFVQIQISQEYVSHYEASGRLLALEASITHLEVTSLDIHQVCILRIFFIKQIFKNWSVCTVLKIFIWDIFCNRWKSEVRLEILSYTNCVPLQKSTNSTCLKSWTRAIVGWLFNYFYWIIIF